MSEIKTSILVVGRAGMDFHAEPAGIPIDRAKNFSVQLGGSAANIASGLASQEIMVELLAAVSSDPIGKFVIGQCEELGINTNFFVPSS